VATLCLVALLVAAVALWRPWERADDSTATAVAPKLWTCAMHPQIKLDKPGKCPLCGMTLIPLKPADESHEATAADSSAVSLTPEAMALARVETTRVGRQRAVKRIRLYGTVQVDERLSRSQTSHFAGRIERLEVDFTGQSVRQGQTIATIYSPELLTAQQELLEAVRLRAGNPALLPAAREKLRLWKLSDRQIDELERSGDTSPYIDVRANTDGIVTRKMVNQGDYVQRGGVLFSVASLEHVWLLFSAYEADLPFLAVGDRVEYTLQALPGRVFQGSIAFIDPMADAATRTVSVRVEADNPRGELKPGMYANATALAPLKDGAERLVVPKSALLWTGKRAVVYVRRPKTKVPTFEMREVEIGPSLGDAYVVLSGITEGEEVVTQGTFVVDASAQLEGKRSMMD
jgi:Cu(I)/Ag(I) efflux system membrane fusion protein